MLKIEKFVTASPEQWEIIIEGMRNPMNSWGKMDSHTSTYGVEFDAINENVPEIFETFGTEARKIYADIYVDDRAVDLEVILYWF